MKPPKPATNYANKLKIKKYRNKLKMEWNSMVAMHRRKQARRKVVNSGRLNSQQEKISMVKN